MHREIQSFVRRKGKMSTGQKRAYEQLKEEFCIPFEDKTLDLKKHFGTEEIVLEIGFGMGDATWHIAKSQPDRGFLAIEVHKPGVGKLLARIESEEIQNIHIVEYDAKKVVNHMLSFNDLAGVHIFFPDPWPKKKHHKRRIIQEPFLSEVLDRLKPKGYLYVVTDWEPYAVHIQEVLQANQSIRNVYDGYADSQTWRPETAFERKGLDKNHNIYEFYYLKK
jgi:tRNA (guanine-N7-)-methyltransferase